MLKGLKKIVSVADQLAFGISAVTLTLLTVVAVFFRFVLNNPIQWVEEVQMILVVWSVFFGGSIAIREKGHIAVDIFFDMLPEFVKKIIDVLIWVIVAVAIAYIGKLEIDRVGELMKSGLRTPILSIPSAVEYIGVVIACGLMLVSHIIDGIETYIYKQEKEEHADE